MATKAGQIISRPKFETRRFTIRGTAPYVSNKFSAEARTQMREKQEAGQQAKKGKARAGKNFEAIALESMHVSTEGWPGLPATAFRNAMISACRIVGFKMTLAKLSVFVEADGFDADDDTPMVRFIKGEPKYCEHAVRNATGVADLRPRMRWAPGWEAVVRVRYDADQFSEEDVAALMERVGTQIGIGPGRPDSKTSAGMGWGLFEIVAIA
jgi:hypothetical protein